MSYALSGAALSDPYLNSPAPRSSDNRPSTGIPGVLSSIYVGAKQAAMSNTSSTPNANTSDRTWILGAVAAALFTITIALIGLVWNNSSSAIKDLQTDSKATTQSVNDLKVDLVRSISGVQQQQAITNQKLDTLIDELRKHRFPP